MAENSGNIDPELRDLIIDAQNRSDAIKKRIADGKEKLIKEVKGIILKDGIDPTHRKLKGFSLWNKDTQKWDVKGNFKDSYELMVELCKMLHIIHPDKDFLEIGGNYFSRGKIPQGKEIPDTDIYVTTRLNNKDKVKFCKSLINDFGYRESDFIICLSH